MRVPIYPNDLLPKAAFKRIAKSIQKKWPGRSPIPLSLAFDALSRGLGYANYHQARSVSLTCSLDARTPSRGAVIAGVAVELSSLLQASNDSSVTSDALVAFIAALPLETLSTFKMAAPLSASLLRDHTSRPTGSIPHVSPTFAPRPTKTMSASTGPLISEKKTKTLENPLKLMSDQEIGAIRTAVERSGSLRDLSLFALLESGLRGHHFLRAKVSQIIEIDTDAWPSSATAVGERSAVLKVDVIRKYIESEGRAPEDYLFPSKENSNQPMPSHEFLQILRSWERAARLQTGQVTPRIIGNVVADQSMPTPPGRRSDS